MSSLHGIMQFTQICHTISWRFNYTENLQQTLPFALTFGKQNTHTHTHNGQGVKCSGSELLKFQMQSVDRLASRNMCIDVICIRVHGPTLDVIEFYAHWKCVKIKLNSKSDAIEFSIIRNQITNKAKMLNRLLQATPNIQRLHQHHHHQLRHAILFEMFLYVSGWPKQMAGKCSCRFRV